MEITGVVLRRRRKRFPDSWANLLLSKKILDIGCSDLSECCHCLDLENSGESRLPPLALKGPDVAYPHRGGQSALLTPPVQIQSFWNHPNEHTQK